MNFEAFRAILVFILLAASSGLALGTASQSERSVWLCDQVRAASKRFPYSNVIAFADGDIQLSNLTSMETAVYPEDCLPKMSEGRLVGELRRCHIQDIER